jgi:acyl-ACP thioesterase
VTGDGASIEASSLWVHLDAATGRPAPLPPRFLEAYADAAGGRTASSRLRLPAPPDDAAGHPWPLRPTDFDVLGHVNNAVYWSIVEDPPVLASGRVVLEHRAPIEPGREVDLVSSLDGAARWLVSREGTVHAAARLVSR